MQSKENKSVALPQQRSEPSKSSKREVVNELSACLALVRPVSMSDDAATEWLTVAAAEIGSVSIDRLRLACRKARRECTFHGQLIPTIMRELEATSYKSADRFLRQWNAAQDETVKLGSRRIDTLIGRPEDFL